MYRNGHRLLLLIVVFFLVGTYMFIFSESGVLEKMVITGRMHKVGDSIESLKKKNLELRSILGHYRKGERTPGDILNSGYTLRNGRVVFLRGIDSGKEDSGPDTENSGRFNLNIKQMRVAWLIFSAIVLLFFIRRRPGETGPAE